MTPVAALDIWTSSMCGLSGMAPQVTVKCSASDSVDKDNGMEEQRQKLARLMDEQPLSGQELRELVFNQWNRSYDVRLQRRGKRMYLHVMWKFLEQKSFHLTESEYDLQLQAVAEYLNMWGVADTVRAGIKAAKHAPGYVTGGNARAYSISLGVEVGGAGRSDEWNSF